jgi:hypothetical protein
VRKGLKNKEMAKSAAPSVHKRVNLGCLFAMIPSEKQALERPV